MMSKHVKLLVLGTLIGVLQGCVSYQSPSYEASYETDRSGEYAGIEGLYGDVYDEVAPNLDVSLADSAYYPWWSVDYYYLGRHHYRPGYWNNPRYSFGAVPPNYWPYYGFYSPFYYPYATNVWYDPWYGWPRYGIGTNFFWQEVYWATRHRNRIPPGAQNPGSSSGVVGSTATSGFTDAFYDHRDRAPVSPVAPGQRSTAPYSVKRTVTPPRTAITTAPRVIRQSRSPQARPGLSSPGISSPRPGPSRSPAASRPGASTSAGPAYKTGKRKKN